MGAAAATVIVVASGARVEDVAELPAAAAVVAADGGADLALALGLAVDVAVGDFDSITPAALAALERAGTRLERHPPEKDATDLELALAAALELRPRRIVVVGGAGGRLDHLLSILLLLGADAFAAVELDALLDRARVHVVRGERVVAGEPGETISLFALHGPADGVSTEGLRYPLRGERLEPGASRGVSNELTSHEARIVVERGVLLAVRP